MPKTKAQKARIMEEGAKLFAHSETAVFTDFTGLSANELNAFRKMLQSVGAKYVVVKKRLLRLLFEREGIGADPRQFHGQLGIVFSPKDIVETAGIVYRFSKGKRKTLAILGGAMFKTKEVFDADYVKRVGQLPPREVLLAQLVGMLSAPIRKLLFVIKEKTKVELAKS